jgi:hypothetical protein
MYPVEDQVCRGAGLILYLPTQVFLLHRICAYFIGLPVTLALDIQRSSYFQFFLPIYLDQRNWHMNTMSLSMV